MARQGAPGISRTLSRRTAALTLLCAALAPGIVGAQAASSPSTARQTHGSAAPGGVVWTDLTAQQRTSLAPLEKDWGTIDAPRKAKWLEIAARFPSMPHDEQRRVHERMAEWARLTPAERVRARLSFQEAKQLTPQERQQRWEAYKALPEDQRKALADRAAPRPEKPKLPASAPLAAGPKQNVAASAPARPAVKPIAPMIVQAKPGATTNLLNAPVAPPQHQAPGQPKIAAAPGQVDRSTLLPKHGPQGAPSSAATSMSKSSARQSAAPAPAASAASALPGLGASAAAGASAAIQ